MVPWSLVDMTSVLGEGLELSLSLMGVTGGPSEGGFEAAEAAAAAAAAIPRDLGACCCCSLFPYKAVAAAAAGSLDLIPGRIGERIAGLTNRPFCFNAGVVGCSDICDRLGDGTRGACGWTCCDCW